MKVGKLHSGLISTKWANDWLEWRGSNLVHLNERLLHLWGKTVVGCKTSYESGVPWGSIQVCGGLESYLPTERWAQFFLSGKGKYEMTEFLLEEIKSVFSVDTTCVRGRQLGSSRTVLRNLYTHQQPEGHYPSPRSWVVTRKLYSMHTWLQRV